jgi:hypothetical protein
LPHPQHVLITFDGNGSDGTTLPAVAAALRA